MLEISCSMHDAENENLFRIEGVEEEMLAEAGNAGSSEVTKFVGRKFAPGSGTRMLYDVRDG